LFICAKDLLFEANGGQEAQSHQAFIQMISGPGWGLFEASQPIHLRKFCGEF
jgi:hypothetical protein